MSEEVVNDGFSLSVKKRVRDKKFMLEFEQRRKKDQERRLMKQHGIANRY